MLQLTPLVTEEETEVHRALTKVLQVKSGSVWTEEFHFMTSNQSLVFPVKDLT